MTREDLPQFLAWLAQLAEYLPQPKMNLEAVVEEYFYAVERLDSRLLPLLLRKVVRAYDWFPTVKQVMATAATLLPEDRCSRCPGGHGVHAGHKVRHDPAGPTCDTCKADMPTPAGYVPGVQPADGPRQLSQETLELSVDEVRSLLDGVREAMEKRAEAFESSPSRLVLGYASQRTAHELATRRAALRQQAQGLGDEGSAYP